MTIDRMIGYFMKARSTVKCGRSVSRYIRDCVAFSLPAIAVLIFAGCSTPSAVLPKSGVNNPDGNIRLYISNQSDAISPVDINVFVDGSLVANGLFDVGSQHSWQALPLKLSPGRHRIVAVSSKGHARLERVFEVDDKLWVALAYWFYPRSEGGAESCSRHFSFVVSKEPIGFQ
jgi:hypothetical protein